MYASASIRCVIFMLTIRQFTELLNFGKYLLTSLPATAPNRWHLFRNLRAEESSLNWLNIIPLSLIYTQAQCGLCSDGRYTSANIQTVADIMLHHSKKELRYLMIS